MNNISIWHNLANLVRNVAAILLLYIICCKNIQTNLWIFINLTHSGLSMTKWEYSFGTNGV